MNRSCARIGAVQAWTTTGRSRRLVRRLELRDRRPHVLAQLYLSEENAGRLGLHESLVTVPVRRRQNTA